MTFEQRLEARLRELEAAVPPARQPTMTTGRRGKNRRAQGMVLLAAVVALLGATAIVATGAADPIAEAAENAFLGSAETRISDDLGPRFSASCVSLEEGRVLVRSRLDALGYPDWVIETRDGAEKAQCVTGAGSGLRAFYLIPSMGGPVGKAMEDIKADLLQRCLDRGEAERLVSSTLERLGATDWTIDVDDRGEVPVGGEQAFADHIAAGCWMYTRSESHPEGGRTYYITGR